MKTPILAAALIFCAAAAPAAAAPDASFDQSLDASALLSQAKEAAKTDGSVVSAQSMGSRYDMDCADISFRAGDGATSAGVALRSQEWETQCQPVGDPRYGGGQNCWDVPGMSWNQTVSVTRQNPQPLLPWEHDTFRVCLQGPWIFTDAVQTAYSYKVVSNGADTGEVVVLAGGRTPEPPDPAGVLATLTPQLKVVLADKWVSYYALEKITLKLKLKKVVKFWPDATLLEKEVSVPVSASESVDLRQFLGEFSSQPEAGQQYYVEYSIARVGSVSDASFTKELETGKVSYAPAVLAFAR